MPFTVLRASAVAGDELAFAALWRRYHPGVVRYLRVLTPGDAEDVAAEVWLQVARDLGRFSGEEQAFRAWLFTVVRRRAIDWGRARRRRPRISPGAIPDTATPDNTDLADEARATHEALRMIGRLPADQADVVLLRIVAGLDVNEVAAVMGKRPGTVRVLAHRGLKRLAEILAADAKSCNDIDPRDA